MIAPDPIDAVASSDEAKGAASEGDGGIVGS